MNPRLLISALLTTACAAPNPIAYQGAELDLFYASDLAPTEVSAPLDHDSTAPPSTSAARNNLPSATEVNGDFSLDLAMDLARTNAIQVLRAADLHLAASADLRLIKADTLLPHFLAGARSARVKGRVQNTDGSFLQVPNKENASLGLSIRFDIDLATATHGIDAARESIRATSWDWIAAELAAETAAALLYYDLLEALARVEITEAAVDNASAYHALVEARFRAGAGLEVDVLRAFAHLAEARQLNVEALAARGMASTHIAELLGLDPLRPLDPTDALEPHDLVSEVAEVDLTSHPILKASQARLAAAEAQAAARRSSWYLPELLLDASFSDFGEDFGSVDDQETLTAAISWDLSPSQFARADRAHADLLRARHDAEADLRRVQSNLVRAQIAALAADDLLTTTESRATAARATVALERTRHEEGDALLIELLDAELSLRRAETAQTAAICTHNRVQHLLRQAIGG